MPLPKSSGFRDWPKPSTALDGGLSTEFDVVTIPVIHELGSDLRANIIESARLLPASRRPIMVKVESQVVTHAAHGAHSAEYLATVRRRKVQALRDAIAGLAQYAGRPDFVVYSYPVLTRINELLTVLAHASSEGNSREILRQVRNTLMNGGWNSYREAAVRQTAMEVLVALAESQEVLPQSVDESFDRLHAAGLRPTGVLLQGTDAEDETPNGEENEIPG